jgi:anti-sigma B factor antagonist
VAELRLSAERRDGSLVVTIAGELDTMTVPELDVLLTDGRRETSWIILDLSGVDFMDTHALAIIVKHWKRLTEAGGILVLAGARYQYTRALWITGLASRLPMNDTVDEAVAAGPAARPAPTLPSPGPKPKTAPPGPVTT